MICDGEVRTALYRFYDAEEGLLYVGITDDPWRRWREHVRQKPWYPLVKHQAVTWYDTRIRAEFAEKSAIRRERPRFNIAGALRPVADEIPANPGSLPEAPTPPAPAPPVPASTPAEEVDPGPEPEPTAPPAANRGHRTMLVILICAAWAFLPGAPGMPGSWRSPWMEALIVSTVIPLAVVVLIAAGPRIHRFGRWLENTFTPDGALR